MGVSYVHAGETRQARARGEVILCGGAINSPQLLLLSGIGPADQLRALDIPIVVDLPGVGSKSSGSSRRSGGLRLYRADQLGHALE